jgi:NitT/TauT family transport system substrate-binding protein
MMCLGALVVWGFAAFPGGAPAWGQSPPAKTRFAIGQAVFNPGLAIAWIGQDLGYFAEEGLDPQFIQAAGGPQVIQLLAGGGAEFGLQNLDPLLFAAAKGNDVPIRYFYNYAREVVFQMAAKPESGITEVRHLKGKRIGVTSFGSTSVLYAKTAARAVGLDPEKDITLIATGVGGQAASALYGEQVDALSMWDALFAQIENLGFKLTHLPHPAGVEGVPGASGLTVRTDYLQQHRQHAVGLGRALAKATVFALENPEAAIRIHWKMYPETKPKGKSDEQAFKDELHVVRARYPKYALEKGQVKKWGAASRQEWDAFVRWLDLEGKVDIGRFLINDLLDEINQFDAEKVRDQARRYRM